MKSDQGEVFMSVFGLNDYIKDNYEKAGGVMRRRWLPNKDALAIVLLSTGIGMLMVILIPTWGFLLALVLIAAGAWMLFLC